MTDKEFEELMKIFRENTERTKKLCEDLKKLTNEIRDMRINASPLNKYRKNKIYN
jgi:hypothetical protein